MGSELKRTPRIPSIEDLDLNVEAKALIEASQQPQQSQPPTTGFNVIEAVKMAKIDPHEELERPPICLSMIIDSGYGIIGTLGNFSLIIGKAKSKKTFCVSMFLTSMVINGIALDKFKGGLPTSKKRVIFFDTEQSKYHVSKLHKRVCRLSGIDNPRNFDSYCLRKHTVEDRLKIIDYVINTTPDLGFVAIDGIRDLVTSINDEDEATKIASYLLRWTEEKNIHIITVLHQNKGDNNARGHVGTELVNKAETVLSVAIDPKDKTITVVEPEFCRDKEPGIFAFSVDEEGLPFLVGDWVPANKTTGKKTVTPENISTPQLIKDLLEMFSKVPQPKGGELLKLISATYNVGDTKAKEFRTYYINLDWIIREGKENNPKGYYVLNMEGITENTPGPF